MKFVCVSPVLSLLPIVPCLAILAVGLEFQYPSMGTANDGTLQRAGNVSFNPSYAELTWNEGDPRLSAGRLYRTDNLTLWDSATNQVISFNTSFSFSIAPSTTAYHGDGLTFFLLDPIINRVLHIGDESKGGYLGLLQVTGPANETAPNPGFFAVEFDTVQNSFDPNGNHVGIDINSLASVAYANLSFSLAPSSTVMCWIDYSNRTTMLEVYVSNTSDTKPETPLLSHSVQMSKILPEQVIIGFSAATGAYAEYHRISSWNFSSTEIGATNKSIPAVPSGIPSPTSSNVIPSPTSSNSTGSKLPALIGGLVSAFVLICFTCLTILLLRKRRRRHRRLDGPVSEDVDLSGLPSDSNEAFGIQRYNYRELRDATHNFSEDFVLGEGGGGSVYRGSLWNQGEVAVKRVTRASKEGAKEFVAEVSIISRIRHRNLVQLKGWCREKNNLLIVYEYLKNGSLDRHLFKANSSSSLDWSQRYSIVCGLGSGLKYLHEECDQVIVHRDIKASNVMLDENFNAKLGDFGLARQIKQGLEGHTTVFAGTLGYMAPETFGTGRATTKSDVYSFGIVLLEVVCGRRPIDSTLPLQNDNSLLDWVWELHSQGALKDACDVRLKEFDEAQLIRTLLVGLACAHPDPNCRPSIHDAVEALNGRIPSPVVPSSKPMMQFIHVPSMSRMFTSSVASSSTTDSYTTDSCERPFVTVRKSDYFV
ncbi:hypothetical protein KP509_18G034500 [Ceratopteris richardii]|uniref:Protein kinase domain-containing protein n=1 Tax=Ceratopteris richardii TaxID=49495 RepID=A0A8T2SNK9_CERRI|nr:hypothetical protein KP509_18G034500 [Ceratopteris richardii]